MHKPLQQPAKLLHGSFVGRHSAGDGVSQRPDVSRHTPLQHSLSLAQESPCALQKLEKLQRPLRHSPEQHCAEIQDSPSVAQPAVV